MRFWKFHPDVALRLLSKGKGWYNNTFKNELFQVYQ